MFIGHYAVAFAAKSAVPRTSLGLLIAAATLLDLLWPIFVWLGFERLAITPGLTVVNPLDFVSYPYSHSLAMSALWGALLGGMVFFVTRHRGGALVVAALVVSHWLLDLIVHRPDLPLMPGGDGRYGFGLWNSLAATVAVETFMFAAGTALYLKYTAARDRTGTYAFAGFLALVLIIYSGSLFGPPPPDADAVLWSAMAQWLIVLLAAWFDRHRAAIPTPNSSVA